MKKMSGKSITVLVAGAVLLCGATSVVLSHCEIPCGIYGDPARLDLMAEHITTIEKSMKQIQDLSAAGDKNYNQLVRWVGNKEQHADAFSDIITQYFMKQRIKPAPQTEPQAYKDYVHKLTLLHQMMVTSMKCKQTSDLAYVAQLRGALAEFRVAYLGK
jgi:nickel superoxide dismutase